MPRASRYAAGSAWRCGLVDSSSHVPVGVDDLVTRSLHRHRDIPFAPPHRPSPSPRKSFFSLKSDVPDVSRRSFALTGVAQTRSVPCSITISRGSTCAPPFAATVRRTPAPVDPPEENCEATALLVAIALGALAVPASALSYDQSEGVYGPPGSQLVLGTEAVPAAAVGLTCDVIVDIGNNESKRPGSDITVTTGSDSHTFLNTEGVAGDPGPSTIQMVMGDTVTLTLTFGPNHEYDGHGFDNAAFSGTGTLEVGDVRDAATRRAHRRLPGGPDQAPDRARGRCHRSDCATCLHRLTRHERDGAKVGASDLRAVLAVWRSRDRRLSARRRRARASLRAGPGSRGRPRSARVRSGSLPHRGRRCPAAPSIGSTHRCRRGPARGALAASSRPASTTVSTTLRRTIRLGSPSSCDHVAAATSAGASASSAAAT